MDNSVYQARWLLAPLFLLWFGLVAIAAALA